MDDAHAHPADPLLEFASVARTCRRTTNHPWRSPAEEMRRLADAAEELAIDDWDRYGAGGPVTALEEAVVGVLGTEAAAFFPSGTMAQQCALRVWSERAGTRRVAIQDLSHLLHHEQDGPRLLHGFEVEALTAGPEVATAAHLDAVPGRLAAALVELPLRDAGCLLPTWDELVALSDAARARGVPLHFDGARLWECTEHFGRSVAEIAALAETTYVSFYKGLGGFAGAALAGPVDVVEEAKRWRHRMGGTTYRSAPVAIAALVGLRDQLPELPARVRWGRALADALADHGIRTWPATPPTNTFRIHAAGEATSVNAALVDSMRTEGRFLTGPWKAADEPGRVVTELAVGAGALAEDPADVAAAIAAVLAQAKADRSGVGGGAPGV